jgi:hypothetical protein
MRFVGSVPAEGQCLGLRDQVGHEQVVMGTVRVVRVGEPDEVSRHNAGPLVQKLVEGVLAVRTRLAPHDRAGSHAHRGSVESYGLAIGFHVQLL